MYFYEVLLGGRPSGRSNDLTDMHVEAATNTQREALQGNKLHLVFTHGAGLHSRAGGRVVSSDGGIPKDMKISSINHGTMSVFPYLRGDNLRDNSGVVLW